MQMEGQVRVDQEALDSLRVGEVAFLLVEEEVYSSLLEVVGSFWSLQAVSEELDIQKKEVVVSQWQEGVASSSVSPKQKWSEQVPIPPPWTRVPSLKPQQQEAVSYFLSRDYPPDPEE